MKSIAQLFAEPCSIPTLEEAQGFSERFGDNLFEWWDAAPQGDWMLWVAAECGISELRLIDAAAACTRLGYRFNCEAGERLEPAVRVAERGGHGEASQLDCRRASDDVHAYANQILESCHLSNTLSAAQVSGSVSQLAAAACFRNHRPTCVKLAVGAVTQLTGAGHYEDGDDSQEALHFQCAGEVRREFTRMSYPCIRNSVSENSPR